jgi:hypothetical protein
MLHRQKIVNSIQVTLTRGLWGYTYLGITRQKDDLTYMDVDYQGNKNILHVICSKV